MKCNITDTVIFDNNGKSIEGDVIDVKGDYYVISCENEEFVVHKNKVLSDSVDSFKDGGNLSVSDSNLEMINSLEFYRYYPLGSNPFKISYEGDNKYGFGIYFLDNPDFYKGRYKDAMLIKIKPNVKFPLLLINHKRTTPSHEYSSMLIDLIHKGEIKHKNDLSKKLLESGYDSLVIFEPRGIYLVLLKENEDLYELIYDRSASEVEEESKNKSNEFSYIIGDLVSNKYKDINGHQGELIYRNFNEDLDGFFIPSKSDVSFVSDLTEKGYLIRDYSIVGDAYILTEKGKKFMEDVAND